MARSVKLTIFACALALAGLGASSFAAADKFPRPCIDCVPGNGPANVGSGQNQGNQGGRQRRIKAPQDLNMLNRRSATQRKFPSQIQPGVSGNGPDQGYSTHRKLRLEAQP